MNKWATLPTKYTSFCSIHKAIEQIQKQVVVQIYVFLYSKLAATDSDVVYITKYNKIANANSSLCLCLTVRCALCAVQYTIYNNGFMLYNNCAVYTQNWYSLNGYISFLIDRVFIILWLKWLIQLFVYFCNENYRERRAQYNNVYHLQLLYCC